MTPKQWAMVQAGRPTHVDLSSPLVTLAQAANAGVRSRIIEITPDPASFLFVANIIVPVWKGYYAGPTEIDPETLLYLGVQHAGKSSPDWADAAFSYHPFADLTASDQANGINRDRNGVLSVDLGKNLLAEDGDKLVIDTDCPHAYDPSLAGAGNRFRIQVRVGRMS